MENGSYGSETRCCSIEHGFSPFIFSDTIAWVRVRRWIVEALRELFFRKVYKWSKE